MPNPKHSAATVYEAPDHHKISITAKLVAFARANSAIPFAQEVSDLVGASAVGEMLVRMPGTEPLGPPAIAPIVEARYLSIVSALKRLGCGQVLEFAAGVSLRGLAMTLENPALTYVDTDLADLTAEKRQITETILARRHLSAPRKYHVRVANVLEWSEIEASLAPFDPQRPVAVVHEGLLMYLSPEEKEVAVRNIARILGQFGGVWITPDLSPVSSWALHLTDEELARATSAIEAKTGRSLTAFSFQSEEEARTLCERHGLIADARPQLDGSYALTTLPPRSTELLARMRERLKLWEMRCASQERGGVGQP